MKIIPTFASLLLAITLNNHASQADINEIEAASMALNSQALVSLINKSTGYTQALAHYRLSISQNVSEQNEQAITSLNSAVTILESITELNPSDDESWALLAQVYGLKISHQPIKAGFYGPKSNNAIAKALTLNDNNPRAHLINGIIKYHTPEMFGGSKTEALTAFNKSITLFDQAPVNNTDWGKSEAYVWRGLTRLALDEKQPALNDWQQALIISPDYGWAKMLLAQNK
ncbi:MAG: hypothetical protein OCD00_10895 [Colwellia sp.]